MTPTLLGRWQTRIFLLGTIGLLISWMFSKGWFGTSASPVYFWVLLYVGLIGLAWDVLYDFLQKYMWDHDWPGAFQFVSAIVEALTILAFVRLDLFPYFYQGTFIVSTFVLHYSTVWIATYLLSWVMMRILFPRWRFRGGQWIGRWSRV